VGHFLGPPANVTLVSSGIFGVAAVSGVFEWIARASPTTNGFNGAAVSNTGVTLAIDTAGDVFRSTDGGVTWSGSLATLPRANAGGLAFNNGVFVAGGPTNGTNGTIFRSANNGTSWLQLVTGTIGNACVNIVGQGAGNFLALETGTAIAAGAKNYAVSTDGGNTWAAGTTFSNLGWLGPQGAIWDGAQYVAINKGLVGPAIGGIATSATGLTWVFTPITNGDFLDNGMLLGGGLYMVPMVTAANATAVRTSATVAGLITAADTLIPALASGGASTVGYDGTLYFAFDFNGGVASSPDAVTWTAEALNFSSGDFSSLVIFDPINNLNIAFGVADGSISTRAP
jgi:hypothetical protein